MLEGMEATFADGSCGNCDRSCKHRSRQSLQTGGGGVEHEQQSSLYTMLPKRGGLKTANNIGLHV